MIHFRLLICVPLLLTACGQRPQPASDTDRKTIRIDAHTQKAMAVNATKEMTFAGRVACNPDLSVSYSPLVSGIIENIYFTLGEKVQKGNPMLDIRSPELSTLQSELIALNAEKSVAKRELESVESMFRDKMISEREYLEAKGKFDQAKASYDKVCADISMFGTSKGNGIFSVVAPASGYIIVKNGARGNTISPGAGPLFTIADISEVWVMANVYASNLQFVKEGQDTEIMSVSYPNEVFHGKISFLSQVFDSEDKALKAIIALPNADLKLKPETSVMVKITARADVQMISVPDKAVIFDKDSSFVVVKNGTGKFSIRPVVLDSQHGQTAMVASGISENEEVVVKNQLLIYSELKGN
ncbi:MAG: efflux RND transporter periplasmic adaptor subunit [Breznakibacter sp.]